ncbi:hypothetical protein LU298_09275 [Komagataeibacter intermedius]|uniref:Uncharacterized protein n=1 Tax=Komagataeibacter intermedius NRIC 0521 TaxID=1307934 RepID=A0ABQ0PNT9_9PROT|nr:MULTISPECIES: hypothetical protein [Komagataeibacter]MCF3636687.1 hypothetical protein [Komagataeibacter intermedius]GBQ76865.1 hypothetical protein AA0521_2973 [Komagataeibacter intermedius NRIC 0521]
MMCFITDFADQADILPVALTVGFATTFKTGRIMACCYQSSLKQDMPERTPSPLN